MKGYRTILMGALMVIAPPLLNYLAGIKWSDFVSADTAFMISGVIAIALRVVTTTPIGGNVTTNTIAKIIVAALALSLFLPRDAVASDVLALTAPTTTTAFPVKEAAPSTWLNGYPYGSSGVIVGLYTGVGGGPVVASVPGVAPASLTTTTAEIGGAVGYAWGNKNSQLAYSLEAKIGATNFNGANQGFSVSGPLSLEQTAYVWMPVSLIQNTLSLLNIPNPFSNIAPFPANPAGITATNVQAGFGAGARWDDMTIAFQGVGSNKVWAVAPKIEFDLMEQMSNASAVREFTEISFPTKGYVFGAKPTSATQSTKYLAGVGVYF